MDEDKLKYFKRKTSLLFRVLDNIDGRFSFASYDWAFYGVYHFWSSKSTSVLMVFIFYLQINRLGMVSCSSKILRIALVLIEWKGSANRIHWRATMATQQRLKIQVITMQAMTIKQSIQSKLTKNMEHMSTKVNRLPVYTGHTLGISWWEPEYSIVTSRMDTCVKLVTTCVCTMWICNPLCRYMHTIFD